MKLDFSYAEKTKADKQLVFMLIEGENAEGEWWYVYTAVLVDKLEEFTDALEKGNVDISKFGKIYSQGAGTPSPEMRKWMEDTYVFGHNAIHVCVVP